MASSFLTISFNAGAKEADLWGSLVTPLTVAILAPIIVQSILQTIKLSNEFVRRNNEQRRLVSGLQDEIKIIEHRNVELSTRLSTDIDNGEFERKMNADHRYFIYVAGDGTKNQIFDPKERDLTFLTRNCFNIIREYYDRQVLITQSIIDLRSDIFRELSTPRKLATLRSIVKLFEQNSETYKVCVAELGRQSEKFDRWWVRNLE